LKRELNTFGKQGHADFGDVEKGATAAATGGMRSRFFKMLKAKDILLYLLKKKPPGMGKHKIGLIFIFSLLLACREAYDPVLENDVPSYLVVEGMINANGVTTIELGRTIHYAEKMVRQFELGAQVEIEGDNSTRFPLTDQGKGLYTSDNQVLARDRKYRLKIKTAAGKEYLSAFVVVNVSAPVTATWTQDEAGVKVMANTVDVTKQAYYHWVTEETWEIISPLPTTYMIVRNPANALQISTKERESDDILKAKRCWATLRSGNILTASAAGFSGGIISGLPLAAIPNGSDKLVTRYSMFVTQYAISREAFEFFELMKKNTETMGSLFDPNPTQIRGNISNTSDPKEIVIGFVDCSVSTSSRIFISAKDANDWKSSMVCEASNIYNTPIDLRANFPNDVMMISEAIWGEAISPIGFTIARAECVDCRLKGNNVRPSFW
jgi:hypothetical protein